MTSNLRDAMIASRKPIRDALFARTEIEAWVTKNKNRAFPPGPDLNDAPLLTSGCGSNGSRTGRYASPAGK